MLSEIFIIIFFIIGMCFIYKKYIDIKPYNDKKLVEEKTNISYVKENTYLPFSKTEQNGSFLDSTVKENKTNLTRQFTTTGLFNTI
mgnify:CR=1 FL=1